MKKTLIIAAALTLGAVASQAQGLVSINLTGGALASTNTTGNVTGLIQGAGNYYFELLTSANTALPSTANQIQTASNLQLWTDTGVSGTSEPPLTGKGKVSGSGAATATGWAAPSGAAYDNVQSYIIIGWSANYGTTYSAFLTSLNAGLTPGGYFGTTAVSLNVAGGGPSTLPSVDLWGNQTGTQGYGTSAGLVLQQVPPTPEPTTIALAGLGGLALLGLRRKKA